MQLLDRNRSGSNEPKPAAPPRRKQRAAGSRPRSDAGAGMVVLGVAVALIGLVGDLVSQTLNRSANAPGGLIVIGRGSSPWHLILFVGILLAAIGAIRWAARLDTDWGALASSATILLLATAVVAGGWSGWKASNAPAKAVTLAAIPGSTSTDTTDTTGSTGSTGSTVASGTGTAGATAGEGAEGQAVTGGHTHGLPGAITDQESRQLVGMLAQVKQATTKYRNIAVAKADGYIQVTQFVPGLGLHMVKVGSALRGTFDYLHPNILLYEPTVSGGLALVGVGYSVPHSGPNPPDGFPGGLDVWHYHTNLCFLQDGSVTITPDKASCSGRGGYFQAQTPWLLHVWIWKANPTGVFTEYNAQVF